MMETVLEQTKTVQVSALPAEEPLVLRRRTERGVVTLTLNRPKQFNALSSAMIAALQENWTAPPQTQRRGLWCWRRRAKPFAPGTT